MASELPPLVSIDQMNSPEPDTDDAAHAARLQAIITDWETMVLDPVYDTTGPFGDSPHGNVMRTMDQAMPFLATQEIHFESFLLCKAISRKKVGYGEILRILMAAVIRHKVEASYMRSSVSVFRDMEIPG